MRNFKPMMRSVHLDFHTNAGIADFGAYFDAEKLAEQLERSNVTYVNIFARCNMGYSYYPTKVGVPYPTLGGRDRFGEAVRACKKRGIGVTGYLHIGLNHELCFIHPEWLNANEKGETYDFSAGGNFFRTPCYNTGYAEHFIAEVKEVLAYGVDGVFCDGFALRPCYCKKCIADMSRAGVDISDKAAVKAFAEAVSISLMSKIRSTVPENTRLMFKGAGQWEGRNTNTHFDIAADDYDVFAANAAYARPLYDEVIYLGGRFQAGWGDFGGYKGRVHLENDVFDSLLQGAGFMLGDHLHPSRLPEPDIYRDLGEIYGKVKKYEKYTLGAKFISEIAIITDSDSVGRSVLAASRMLSELKYQFDIINVEGDFSKYPVIILPDRIKVGSDLKTKLKSYLENGGRVISSGLSGIEEDECGFALPEWSFEYIGIDPNEEEERTVNQHETCSTSYFELAFDAPIAKMQYAAYDTGILMKSGEGNVTLADEVNSHFEKIGYDGRHYIFYTPQKEKTGNSALSVNSKGNVAHFSFKVFSSYAQSYSKVYKLMLKRVLEDFLPDPLILADKLPATSRATVTGCDEYKLLHIKVTYPEKCASYAVIEEHNVLPEGSTVSVKGDYSAVKLLPEECDIAFRSENGYTEIALPKISGYCMLLLKH